MLNGLIGKRGCVVWGGLLLISQIALAEIIPASRRADWTLAGVPGGIPNRTNIFVNVLTTTNANYFCNTNAADISVPLYNAIMDCPANQVVYIPTGVYTLSNSVRTYGPTNCTIRGDGPGKTIIISKTGGNGTFDLEYGDIPTNNIWNIVGSNPAGTSNITVTGFGDGVPVVGHLLWIDQTNDYYCTACTATQRPPGLVNTTDYTGHSMVYCDRPQLFALPDETAGDRSMQQIVRITAVNSNTITFWPPLFWEFDQSKQARAACFSAQPISLVGFEDMTISNDQHHAVASMALFRVTNADRCWFKNVELSNLATWGWLMQFTVQCQVEHCYIHDQIADITAKNGYGFEDREATALLFQNNIVAREFASIMRCCGSIGCVNAYNYITDTQNTDPTSLMMSMNGSHCGHPMMNLYEGNVMAELETDNSSSHNTTYRNWLLGTDVGITSNMRTLALDLQSLSNNVVGNILGVSNIVWTYSETNSAFPEPVIYRLGYPCIGNSYLGSDGSGGPCPPYCTNAFWSQLDTNVVATLLRHGNYDYATKSTIWDPNIVDTNLPPSLYLTGKPSWWGSGRWPAIGPDLNPMVQKIPAQARFEAIMSAKISLIKTGPSSTP